MPPSPPRAADSRRRTSRPTPAASPRSPRATASRSSDLPACCPDPGRYGPGRSGARAGAVPQVAREPLEHDLEALVAMARRAGAGELVALAREPDQLHLGADQAQQRGELLGLLGRAAPVLLRVDDERRRADARGVGDRRLPPQAVVVVQRRAAEQKRPEPQADVARALDGLEVERGPLDDRAGEAV